MNPRMGAAAALLSVSALAAPLDLPPEAELRVRLPEQETVPFRGMANFDGAGGNQTQILYPAPSLAAGLAAVLTHAGIESSRRSAEKERLQAEADKVLEPYVAVLRGFKHAELFQQALIKATPARRTSLVDAAAKPGGAALVVLAPVFFMPQDQSALVLETEVAIHAHGPATEQPAYRNVVRVVSTPRDEDKPDAFWLANHGSNLKQAAAALMAESLSIALQEAAGAFAGIQAPQRTVRYVEGKSEKMERAHIIRSGCDRLVVKTLRDTLLSVPLKAAGPCAN